MSDPTSIIQIGNQGLVDREAVDKATAAYRGALSKTQGELKGALSGRQDITTRNLAAIDEAITGLKNARTGTYGFDPAVSAAMAAGFLKSTPGVAGNFMTELGGAMGNAAPVIAGLQNKDRDSFALLADLQRKRGEYEAEPIKDTIKSLEERERAEQAGLRGVEVGGLRSQTAAERDALKAQAKADTDKAKLDAAQQKLLEGMQTHVANEVGDILKKKEDISLGDVDLLKRYHLKKRVDTYNKQNPSTPINLPEPFTDEDQKKATALMQSVEEKGLDENKKRALTEIRGKSESFVKGSMDPGVWSSMSEEDKRALIEDDMRHRIQEHNDSFSRDPNKQITKWEPPPDEATARARDNAKKILRVGEPEEQEIKAANLPVKNAPNDYAHLDYAARKKKMEAEETRFNRDIATQRGEAEKLGDRKQQALLAEQAYKDTFFKGGVWGRVPADWTFDANRQEVQKIIADMGLTNVPHGQGSISDADRKVIMQSNPSAVMQPEAFKAILKAYVNRAQRASDEVTFAEQWQTTFRTQKGMRDAWNRYLADPRSAYLTANKGKITENPNHLSWQDYFAKENEGGATSDKPVPKWNPTTRKVE